jgi:hypothetical protein
MTVHNKLIYIFTVFVLLSSTSTLKAQVTESDSTEVESDDENDENEGDFDANFTGYSDVTYWDLLRDPNFKFDAKMIPATQHYEGVDWDTITINPYKVSLNFTHLLLEIYHPTLVSGVGGVDQNFIMVWMCAWKWATQFMPCLMVLYVWPSAVPIMVMLC